MKRTHYLERIAQQLEVHPVCALLGPRQVGKTTLAHMFAEHKANLIFFDLENPFHLARIENPMLALGDYLNHFIVIDEVQLRPDLFPILRVLADDPLNHSKYLILGSASRDLLKQSSESLAGRIGFIEVSPFSLDEVSLGEELWVRGGFPKSYLSVSNETSFLWRQEYITTYLERDIPMLGFQIPPAHIRRFWLMLSHYHGQMFNASEIGRSLSISDHTAKRYLDILAGTFMIRILQPWFENLSKRQVKTPKIYFRDIGIFNGLIGLKSKSDMDTYPKLGALWEGFAMEQMTQHLELRAEDCFFWGTQGGAEIDLFFIKNGKRYGIEFKYSEKPKITPSMRIAQEDLQLEHLFVVFPGKEGFPLEKNITVISLHQLKQVQLV